MRILNLNFILIPFITCLMIFSIYCKDSNSQKQNNSSSNDNTSVKDTCEGPDSDINCCFEGMPETINNILRIADKNEPGERMIIKGTIFKEDGATPYPGIIIYAYHTNNSGQYPKKGNEKGIRKWHGHLYGWAKTDGEGRYEIHSIRPATYPSGGFPAHIHSAIKEPGRNEPFYINDFVFKDDSYVDDNYVSSLRLKGGPGVVDLKKNENDVWTGVRDIVLK